MDNQQFFTVKQLAERWECTAAHVLDLIHTATIPAVDISIERAGRKRWIVPREAVEQFENDRQYRMDELVKEFETRARKAMQDAARRLADGLCGASASK